MSDSSLKHKEKREYMGKIQSIIALRGLAIIGIFLLHVGCPFQYANLSVSLFFVLSGFLLTYRYINTGVQNMGKLAFAIQQVKKIYPLHIIMMLMVLLLNILQLMISWKDVCKILLNILLLQSWYPSVRINISLNGVSWFLSSIVFCWFMFPIIVSWLSKNKENRIKLLLVFMTVLALQLILTTFLVVINIKEDVFRWATYDAPFFRVCDFLCGAIAGAYVNGKSIIIGKKISIKWIFIAVGLAGIFLNCFDSFYNHQSICSKVLGNWTTIYIPIATCLVVLCYYEREFLSKNRVLMYIGENSGYYFLIHYAVIKYLKTAMVSVGYDVRALWWVTLVMAGIITIILTEAYKNGIEDIMKTETEKIIKRTIKFE